MDFSLSEDQQAIQDLARQIISDRATDDRVKQLAEGPGWYDDDLWTELANASLLGVAIREDLGGGGFGMSELTGLCEEAGRCIAPLPILSTLVLGALPIQEFGSDDQKKCLPDVTAGKTFLTAALAEMGHVDPARPATTAKKSGDGWVLDGVKVCVPDANRAARIVVPARMDGGAVGVFLISPDQAGVALEREITTNGEPQFTVTLTGATAEALGDPSKGAEVVRWIERRATIALSALQLGISFAALMRTAEYAKERKQFEKPIGSFQAYQLRAADAFIDVEAIRSTLYQAIWAVDEDRDADKAVEVAKWWACRAGHRVAHSTQHLHGGIGADVDYPIHRFFLWTKQTEYSLGGASVHLARLGALLAEGEDA
ncbi:MAG: acyl-CoA/acyl-ACP dehydrogenase [Candidatus Binatia bacterium]|nr:acyl-CoA/acyl-ACP dehydrogenase [Candidatus Binatia bacterium]